MSLTLSCCRTVIWSSHSTLFTAHCHDTHLKPTCNHPEYHRHLISGCTSKKSKRKKKHSYRFLVCCNYFSTRVWEYCMSYPHQHQGHWLAVVRGRCFLSWGIDRAKDISKVLKVGKKFNRWLYPHTYNIPWILTVQLWSEVQKFAYMHEHEYRGQFKLLIIY